MIESTITADLVRDLLDCPDNVRKIVAIAGPPGSGKSTLAENLVNALNKATPETAAVFPMDGYHFDDQVLGPMGLQSRKGAPETFDVAGFAHMLGRLRKNVDPTIAVPVFDRGIEIARAGARIIPQTCKIIVTEGNYLLLNQTPWDILSEYFDTTIMLVTDAETLYDRLVQRWENSGLSDEHIRQKLTENDLPNGQLVIESSIRPDHFIKN